MGIDTGPQLQGVATLPVVQVTPAQVAAAKRVVLKYADDWIEAADFMAALGLETA
jgi:hypothetical protein